LISAKGNYFISIHEVKFYLAAGKWIFFNFADQIDSTAIWRYKLNQLFPSTINVM